MVAPHSLGNYPLGSHLAWHCSVVRRPQPSERLVHRHPPHKLHRHFTHYIPHRLQTQTHHPECRYDQIRQEWEEKTVGKKEVVILSSWAGNFNW